MSTLVIILAAVGLVSMLLYMVKEFSEDKSKRISY